MGYYVKLALKWYFGPRHDANRLSTFLKWLRKIFPCSIACGVGVEWDPCDIRIRSGGFSLLRTSLLVNVSVNYKGLSTELDVPPRELQPGCATLLCGTRKLRCLKGNSWRAG